GYLFLVRDETLMAQPFDADRFELSGEPARVADGVWGARGAAQASFSVSPRVLAYVNASLSKLLLVWFDRAGRRLETIRAAEPYTGSPQLSPDGKRFAVAVGPGDSCHVWLVDAANGTS